MRWDGVPGRLWQLAGWINQIYAIKVCLLALAYLVSAKLGLLLAFESSQIIPMWPPTGIALGALLLLGYRYWPGILIGAFLTNVLTGLPWFVAGAVAAGNTAEALTGAFLLRSAAGIKPDELLATSRNIMALFILGVMVSTTVSATVGVASLAVGGLVQWSSYAHVWIMWWAGNMMSSLIFTPLSLCLSNPNCMSEFWRRRAESSTLLVLSFVLSVFIFTYSPQWPLSAAPLPYITLIILIWAAFRLTHTEVVFALFIIATTGVWGTISGLGPFARTVSMEENLMLLQLFLFTAAITFLLVAAAVSERSHATETLRQQSEELKKAQAKMTADLEERQRLVRELEDANRRATGILEEILDEDKPRRSTAKRYGA